MDNVHTVCSVPNRIKFNWLSLMGPALLAFLDDAFKTLLDLVLRAQKPFSVHLITLAKLEAIVRGLSRHG